MGSCRVMPCRFCARCRRRLGESWRVLALNLPTRYMSCHTCGFGLSLQAPLDGALRGSPHLCRPIRSFSLRTVVAHPFPAGRCLRLPGRTCVRHVRQASASSEGSFVSLRWCCRATIRACGVFAPPSPGHPKAKRPGCSRPRRTDGGLKHESYLSAVPCSSPSLSAAPVRRAQTRLYRTLAHATFRPRAEYGTRPDRITTAGEADYNGMKPII